MFKFNFKKLGPIKEGSVTLAPFTIICGRNNVGKTYISHAIYACLLEVKKQLFSLDPITVQSALKADREFGRDLSSDFDIQTVNIKNNIPSPKDISSKVNSELSKGGLAKFFNSESIFKELEIDFEFNLDMDDLIYRHPIHAKYDFGGTEVSCHKLENSYDLILTFIKKNEIVKNEIGPSIVSIIAVNNALNSLVNLDSYIATSERTGIALFQPTFDTLNTQLGREAFKVKKMGKSPKHIASFLGKLHNFPQPVIDNIEFIRTREPLNTLAPLKDSGLLSKQLSRLSGGEFLEKSDSIDFKPSESTVTIPFSMASSSSKSVYLIEKFIKREAKSGSILIIDEPELNLHIDNQVQMANLLATLVNNGVQVLITTHSDHMLREINILMMLGSKNANSDEKREILDEYKIEEPSVLDPEKVKAYVVSSREGRVFDVEKTKYGLDLDLFNKEIIGNNRKIRDIQKSLFN